MTDTPTDAVPEFSPAEAFALLGDETRVAILEALAHDRRDAVPFGDLRDLVGVADSGRFNYHLKKLVGRFVEKRDDGYGLTYAGMRVVGAVYEGTYARGEGLEPIELDEPCPLCDGSVVLEYADERVSIACSDCGEMRTEFGFPPGALANRERGDLPRLLSRHIETLLDRAVAGFCVSCSGSVAPEFDSDDGEIMVHFECERCGERVHAGLPSVLVSYPAVVAFHYDHGVNVREEFPWQLAWLADSETAQVSTDPPHYAVAIALDDERFRIVVDENLEVVETERTAVETAAAE